MSDNDASIRERVTRSMQGVLDEACARRLFTLGHHCESPIELMLGAAIALRWDLESPTPPIPMDICAQKYIDLVPGYEAFLVPQFEMPTGHRLDFLLQWKSVWADEPLRIGIECDGHEFHEKTKDQATRDKRRDRAIQMEGVPIYRFTGSEIFKNPASCAKEVLEIVQREDMRAYRVAHPEMVIPDDQV